MKVANQTTGARLRLVLAPRIAIGPGKADLLEGIRETGSIAAAGRRMGMSYKRAWGLVETLNGYFSEPLVATSRGGAMQGGAALTTMGAHVLDTYRRMEARTAEAVAEDFDALRNHLADPLHGT